MINKKIKNETKKTKIEEELEVDESNLGEDKIIEELDSRDKEIEDLKKENEELEIKLKTSLSDYQNFKRRVDNEKDNGVNVLNSLLLREFLNVLDNIYLYLKHLEKNNNVDKSVLSGIKMIYDQGNEVVVSQGLLQEEVKVGDRVSPLLHEVVGTVVGENENIITEVVRVGYEKDGKIIRPARVIVEKKEV